MKMGRVIGLLCAMLLGYSTSSLAALLNIQNEILMGAQGVIVNGVSYDVSFQDGTCISLFGGCDESSDFFIPDLATGQAANAALLEQVFIDTSAGQFDSIPGLTNGCGGAINDFGCNIHSPIGDPPPTSSDLLPHMHVIET